MVETSPSSWQGIQAATNYKGNEYTCSSSENTNRVWFNTFYVCFDNPKQDPKLATSDISQSFTGPQKLSEEWCMCYVSWCDVRFLDSVFPVEVDDSLAPAFQFHQKHQDS